MKDKELIRQLELRLMSRVARINDLEKENQELKRKLDYTVEALNKADAKLIDLQKN